MEPKEQAAQLPERPGVYMFKDAGGHVIYAGKANSLRNRVRPYFLESRWIDAKTGSLARENGVTQEELGFWPGIASR